MASDAYKQKVRIGIGVAIALAVLSVIEFVIATGVDRPMVWLLPFIVAKGGLILQFFMHVSDLNGKAAH